MANTLQLFRKHYPQYQNIADQDVARLFHENGYGADLEFDDFSFKFGSDFAEVPDWVRLNYPRQRVSQWSERGKIGASDGWARSDKTGFDPTGITSIIKNQHNQKRLKRLQTNDYDNLAQYSDYQNSKQQALRAALPAGTVTYLPGSFANVDKSYDLLLSYLPEDQRAAFLGTDADKEKFRLDDIAFAQHVMDQAAEAEVRGHSVMGYLAESAPELTGFLGSMAMTGGVGGLARGAVKTGVRKALTNAAPKMAGNSLGKFAINRAAGLTGAVASGAARTAALPALVGSKYEGNIFQQRLANHIANDPDAGVDNYRAAKNALLNTIFEFAGEEAGRDLIKIGGKLIPVSKVIDKLPPGAANALHIITGSGDPAKRSKMARYLQRKLRVGGFTEEWLEEDYTNVMNLFTTAGSLDDVTAPYTDLQQAQIRGATLGLMQSPGIAGSGVDLAGKGFNGLGNPGRYQNEIKSLADHPGTTWEQANRAAIEEYRQSLNDPHVDDMTTDQMSYALLRRFFGSEVADQYASDQPDTVSNPAEMNVVNDAEMADIVPFTGFDIPGGNVNNADPADPVDNLPDGYGDPLPFPGYLVNGEPSATLPVQHSPNKIQPNPDSNTAEPVKPAEPDNNNDLVDDYNNNDPYYLAENFDANTAGETIHAMEQELRSKREKLEAADNEYERQQVISDIDFLQRAIDWHYEAIEGNFGKYPELNPNATLAEINNYAIDNNSPADANQQTEQPQPAPIEKPVFNKSSGNINWTDSDKTDGLVISGKNRNGFIYDIARLDDGRYTLLVYKGDHFGNFEAFDSVIDAQNYAEQVDFNSLKSGNKSSREAIKVKRGLPIRRTASSKATIGGTVRGGYVHVLHDNANIRGWFVPVKSMIKRYKNRLRPVEIIDENGKEKTIQAIEADINQIAKVLKIKPDQLIRGSGGYHLAGSSASTRSNMAGQTDQELLATVITAAKNKIDDAVESDRSHDDESDTRLRQLAGFLGLRVIFFSSSAEVNGLSSPELPGVIFINRNAQNPALTVLGHELLHTIRTASDLDNALKSELRGFFDALLAGLGKDKFTALALKSGLADGNAVTSAASEEVLADALGAAFNSVQFWNSLQRQAPGIFNKFVSIITQLIQRLKLVISRGADPLAEIDKNKLPAVMASAVKMIHTWQMRAGDIKDPGIAGSGVKYSGYTNDKVKVESAVRKINLNISYKSDPVSLAQRVSSGYSAGRVHFIDSLSPLEAFDKKTDYSELPSDSPYQLATFLNQKNSARADYFLEVGPTNLAGNRKKYIKSLADIIAPYKGNFRKLQELNSYLIAKRVIGLDRRGIEHGFDMDAVHTTLKAFGGEFHGVAEDISKYAESLLDYLVESGALTAAEKARYVRANPFYVPFYRTVSNDKKQNNDTPKPSGFHDSNPVKKIEGGTAPVINPIESLVMQTQFFISRANKAAVARSIANKLIRHGEAYEEMIEEIEPPQEVFSLDRKELLTQLNELGFNVGDNETEAADLINLYGDIGRKNLLGPNIISCVVNGRRKYYRLDGQLFDLISGMDHYIVPPIMEILALPARTIRAGATALNPTFGLITNFMRDNLTYYFTSDSLDPLGSLKGLAADRAHVLGLIHDPDVEQTKGLGGDMAQSQTRQDRGKNRRSSIDKAEVLTGTRSRAKKAVKFIPASVDVIRNFLTFAEAGPRVHAFKQGVKKAQRLGYGRNSLDTAVMAFNAYQDASVNFSRAGRSGRVINQIVPFFNAGIQGQSKFWRAFRADPGGFTAKAISFMTVPSVLLWYVNKDKEWYKNLRDHDRASYWHIEISDGVVMRFPKPFEVGYLFGSLPEMLLDDSYGSKQDRFASQMSYMIQQSLPIELRKNKNNDWFQAVALGAMASVGAIGPVSDVISNYDFAGREIVPASMERYLAKPDQVKGNTIPFIQDVIKSLDLNLSPIQVQHIINGYTGGIVQRTGNYYNSASDLAKGQAIENSNIPVLGTLFQRYPFMPQYQLDNFYDRKKYLEDRKKKLRGADLRELNRIQRTHKLIRHFSNKLYESRDPEYQKRIGAKLTGLLKNAGFN